TLRTLKNKTLRYPGHAALIKPLVRLGFLDKAQVHVGGNPVSPRALSNTLLAAKFAAAEGDRDVMVIHIVGRGRRENVQATATLDLAIAYDDATGFTGMERATGFHLA